MDQRIWKCTTLLAIGLGLTACGSNSNNNQDPSVNEGAGTEPDHYTIYGETGLYPSNLPDIAPDENTREAVQAGYLAFGTLVAAIEMQMGLRPLGWAVPAAIEAIGPHYDSEQQWTVACSLSDPNGHGIRIDGVRGDMTVFRWEETGKKYLSPGTEVLFGFDDCRPENGVPRFSASSDDPEDPPMQSFTRYQDEDDWRYRLVLDRASVDEYPDFVVNGGPLMQGSLDVDGQEIFVQSNAGVDNELGSISLLATRGEQPVELVIRGEREGATQASIVRSWKPDDLNPNRLRFEVPQLEVELNHEGSELAGTYVLNSQQLDYHYKERRIVGGGFTVVGPNGAIYSFELDADPDYLHVTIDEAGDGVVDSDGRFLQPFVVNQLQLN